MTEETQETCLCRNALVHAVIWPKGPKASIALIDTDEGVVHSEFKLTEPVKGSVYAAMMPDGFVLDCNGCTVLSMSGKLIVRTETEFDTVVVTERAEVTFEDRMQRLERRERRRERRERQLEEEARTLRERLAQREGDAEAVVEPSEPETAPEAATEPEDKQDA